MADGDVRIPDAVRARVIARDGGCVAPKVDPQAGECRDFLGLPLGRHASAVGMELDHVRDAPMAGRTAPSDEAHLVTLCPGHHRGMGDRGGRVWATANRPLLREYLGKVGEGERWQGRVDHARNRGSGTG